jgi:hypothetical protein
VDHSLPAMVFCKDCGRRFNVRWRLRCTAVHHCLREPYTFEVRPMRWELDCPVWRWAFMRQVYRELSGQ